LGADDCGIVRLNPDFIYSHAGRGPEPHGSEIVPEHRFAVAFALEMEGAFARTEALIYTYPIGIT
jgi:hypothetical protein